MLPVGRCRLTPDFRSSPRACFQRLKVKHEKLLSNFAFKCNLRLYIPDLEWSLRWAASDEVEWEEEGLRGMIPPEVVAGVKRKAAAALERRRQ